MSGAQLYFPLAILILLITLPSIYIIRGKLKQRKPTSSYHWKPEQDYDVVLRGETPMSPGFPVLKRREKPKKQ